MSNISCPEPVGDGSVWICSKKGKACWTCPRLLACPAFASDPPPPPPAKRRSWRPSRR